MVDFKSTFRFSFTKISYYYLNPIFDTYFYNIKSINLFLKEKHPSDYIATEN